MTSISDDAHEVCLPSSEESLLCYIEVKKFFFYLESYEKRLTVSCPFDEEIV